MYDGDVAVILEQLKNISSATMIISNPSIELWFLYHYKNQKAEMNADACMRELSNRNKNQYKKGLIDRKLQERLNAYCEIACERAKKSRLYENPSSNLFLLIEALEKPVNGKHI